jgi:hypothetical protein
VELATVKALLTDSALARLTLSRFHFCARSDCDVVYFSDCGDLFGTSEIRVLVWQKLPEGTRTLCYCFGENESSMQQELEAQGRTLAVERVREHIAAGRCACDVRNPRGSCCLGDLIAAAKQVEARLHQRVP